MSRAIIKIPMIDYMVLRLSITCVVVVVLGCLIKSETAYASTIDDLNIQHIDSIPFAFVDAAVLHDVPPIILFAVALTESADYRHEFVSREVGRRAWPWTLNIHGQGYRYASREEACIALMAKLRTTRVIDVGIAQLNIRWNPHLFKSGGRFSNHPCDAFDPYANLEEAARLLSQHYQVTQNWLHAAGRYHRPAGGEHAERYRQAVSREIQRILNDQTLAGR